MTDKGRKGTQVIRGGAVTLAMPESVKSHTGYKKRIVADFCTIKKERIYGQMVLQVNL